MNYQCLWLNLYGICVIINHHLGILQWDYLNRASWSKVKAITTQTLFVKINPNNFILKCLPYRSRNGQLLFSLFFVTAALKPFHAAQHLGSKLTDQKVTKYPERSATLCNFVGFQTLLLNYLYSST